MSHKLTPKQLKVLAKLASGISTIQIAKDLKLRRETITRWRQIPEFMQEYDRLMGEVRLGLKNKITEVMNATLERISHEVGGGFSDPQRIDAFLNILKTMEKSCDNAQK
jgi:hypothetical protein